MERIKDLSLLDYMEKLFHKQLKTLEHYVLEKMENQVQVVTYILKDPNSIELSQIS